MKAREWLMQELPKSCIRANSPSVLKFSGDVHNFYCKAFCTHIKDILRYYVYEKKRNGVDHFIANSHYIQDRITRIIESEMTIEQIGTIQINSSTDSMQTSRDGGNPRLAQDRANTLFDVLTTQINPPIPANQINITTAPNTIPPGQVNWQTAKASGVNKLTWQQNNAPARMVSISFPEAKGPDIDIKPVKATPPRDVDTPKTVYINHLQVYIKK